MKRLKTILVAAFAVVLACGPQVGTAQTATPAPAVQTQTATISGRATDTGGRALPGVQIFIDGAVHQLTTTDASGTYTLTVPAGLYLLSASKAGYDPATVQDLTLAPGQTIAHLDVTMSATTLTSLRTIGTVRTGGGTRSIFNGSALSVTTMDAAKIDVRVQPNLSKLVAELPGVTTSQNSGGRDPNSSWDVRGARIESKVTIDGHTVSTGVSGSYNNIFANSEIFEQVEIVKGPGINGVNAGESAFGLVNLRTRGFTDQNSYTATIASDIFGSGHYFFGFERALSPKLSVLAYQSFQGLLGPDQGVPGPVANVGVGNVASPTYHGLGMIQWQQDLSHPFASMADLVKARFKFSNATSITAEYVNFTGRYFTQGGSYAYEYGPWKVAGCAPISGYDAKGNPIYGALATNTGCGPLAVYGAPQQFGQVGTTQQLYSYFPNSYINNQEPQYSLEFKTLWKNETFFVRPYWTEIRRYIDGTTENLQPGNAGGWYQVTNNANCTVQFAKPTTAAGASGPCFTSADNYTTPYVKNANTSTFDPYFNYSATPVNCSLAAPCYTTPTSQQRNGQWAFGGPFSQPEYDKLAGVTFSWLHPVGENLYTVNADYSSDFTTKATADLSPLPAGCVSAVAPVPGQNVPTLSAASGGGPNPYYQPKCALGGAILSKLPTNAVGIPPTWNRKLELSATALWQLNSKLQVGFGNYLTFENIYLQYTDPKAIAAAAALKTSTGVSLSGAEPSDATLIGSTVLHAHYDPHFQASYRVNDNISLRAAAGSSITMPYATLVSGFGSFTPNVTPTLDGLRLPNPGLQPETTVSYNVGMDQRMKDGTVLSVDLFNNNIHNVFVTVSQPAATNVRAGFQTIQSLTVNGPDQMNFGLEATMQKAPTLGLGYLASVTLQRAFYYGFSNSFYAALVAAGNTAYQPIINGKQMDGTGGFQDQIPYSKGKFELNYAFPKQRAYTAFGLVYSGSNNPWGVPAFATTYGNVRYNLPRGLTLGVSAENLFNYSSGGFYGQVIANAGPVIQGVKWSPGCSCLINGSPFSTPNSAVVVLPRNVYFSLSWKP